MLLHNTWLGLISPRLNTIWTGTWKAGTVEPGRYLYDHELVLVMKGSCRVRVGRTFYELSTGTFLIIPPGNYHTTLTHFGGVCRACLHFDWVPSDPREDSLPLWTYHPRVPRNGDLKRAPTFVSRHPGPLHFALQGPVPPLLETIRHRWHTGSKLDRATCDAVFRELMLRLLWRGPTHPKSGDRATQLAYEVKELLDRNPLGTEAIQPLLASLGFSYAHLCRIFRSKFGLSPVRYRNAAKLERAQNLLRDPKRTVAEAAYEAGFNDPAYFSRKFRQRHGTSPSRFR